MNLCTGVQIFYYHNLYDSPLYYFRFFRSVEKRFIDRWMRPKMHLNSNEIAVINHNIRKLSYESFLSPTDILCRWLTRCILYSGAIDLGEHR